jgi:hypothetical protein
MHERILHSQQQLQHKADQCPARVQFKISQIPEHQSRHNNPLVRMRPKTTQLNLHSKEKIPLYQTKK